MPHTTKAAGGAPSRRLIEEWLPIAALSEESVRERRMMIALPPVYYLHVWWARRPLVASRAAILGALLPHDADHKIFMHTLGIHGDPVAAKARMAAAAKNVDPETGEREDLGGNIYGYERAFKYSPTNEEITALRARFGKTAPVVLDPTSGGGSVPFEATRLGCLTLANDLNPVAWLVLKTTVEFPKKFGTQLLSRFRELSAQFVSLATPPYERAFPSEKEGVWIDGYLWARTITCPYCGGVIPLSPNWRLDNKGTQARLVTVDGKGESRKVRFEIVNQTEPVPGTVSGGDASCPFTDCERVIDGVEIKAQATGGKMGEQLYAIAYRVEKIVGYTKAGRAKIKSEHFFRAPTDRDDPSSAISDLLSESVPDWQAKGIFPDEEIDLVSNYDRGHRMYGMTRWTDLFSPRQRFGHCVSVAAFQEVFNSCQKDGRVSEIDAAALSYVCLAMDKLLNYNSRMSIWMPTRQVIANTFNRHNFAFQWSYAEMAPAITGTAYKWAMSQVDEALEKLVGLTGDDAVESDADANGLFASKKPFKRVIAEVAPIIITCGSGDSLPHIADASVDAVVMDPPYYDNVMYAELADFFYVWLKRTAGLLYPEQFSSYLTDKDREAVANSAKFRDFSKVKGSGGAKKRASRDYQERMQAIFTEQRRVLKPDGLMVLMFTHKATGAWDALAKGLVDAGFTITASWPVNTEAEGSLHIKDKNAAKSTIFLVCRPRPPVAADAEVTYWEDVEPKVVEVVRKRVAQFQEEGIGGVDLYLSCFGPALQVFSEYWPMKRGRANQKPAPARGAQLQLIEDEEWDPYAVRPEDALMAARRAVKDWRMEQLATVKRQAHLDPVSEFFVLAWDAFKAPEFPADEALKLARVVGVNFDEQLRGKVLDLKGGDVVLWDSAQRAQKGVSGSLNGDCLLNALHHAARIAREQNVGAAQEALKLAQLDTDDRLQKALQAMLNVLPTPKMVSATSGSLAGAAADAEALEKLRRLMFAKEVPQAKQWLFEV